MLPGDYRTHNHHDLDMPVVEPVNPGAPEAAPVKGRMSPIVAAFIAIVLLAAAVSVLVWWTAA